MLSLLLIPEADTLRPILTESCEPDELKNLFSNVTGQTVTVICGITRKSSKTTEYIMHYIGKTLNDVKIWEEYEKNHKINFEGARGPVMIERYDEKDMSEEEIYAFLTEAETTNPFPLIENI